MTKQEAKQIRNFFIRLGVAPDDVDYDLMPYAKYESDAHNWYRVQLTQRNTNGQIYGEIFYLNKDLSFPYHL